MTDADSHNPAEGIARINLVTGRFGSVLAQAGVQPNVVGNTVTRVIYCSWPGTRNITKHQGSVDL